MRWVLGGWLGIGVGRRDGRESQRRERRWGMRRGVACTELIRHWGSNKLGMDRSSLLGSWLRRTVIESQGGTNLQSSEWMLPETQASVVGMWSTS
jgi:hypothetical protein